VIASVGGHLKVICVCKSGGGYDEEWVRKLKDAVSRNLTIPYDFGCLSDLDIPDRIPLKHKWPGWWSKIELFREITGPTLYLDLDTVITGNLDHFSRLENDFAMLRNFHVPEFVGSGVMWFGKPQKHVYERFCEKPFKWIEYHERKRDGPYLGDQAFIWESMGRKVDHLPMETIKSYKFHCRDGLPKNTSIVCFHGLPKLPEVKADWIEKNWL
jgi:hypothetical protein